MKLNYNLDLDPKSTWNVRTPSNASRRLPFFICEYGEYLAGPAYFTERQRQKNFLFLYTLSGKGSLHYRGREYILSPHQALILSCDPRHLYGTLRGSVWNFRWFHFGGMSAKAYEELLNRNELSVVTFKNPFEIEKLLEDLFLDSAGSDLTSDVKSSLTVDKILSCLILRRYSPDGEGRTAHQEDIDRVVAYIRRSYAEEINMDGLVKVACMSKYYFIRVFKSRMGVSPYEFLINYRITKAKELLKTSELSVREIGERVGFSDCNNFIRTFRKTEGTTPLQYRRE